MPFTGISKHWYNKNESDKIQKNRRYIIFCLLQHRMVATAQYPRPNIVEELTGGSPVKKLSGIRHRMSSKN